MDTFYYRPYAYSPKGFPVKAKISGKRYQRTSLVAAQIKDQSKLIAPMTYSGTMDSHLFEAWFERVLLPELTKPSVIVMDNARFHRMSVLAEMAEKKRGIKSYRLHLTCPSLIRLKKCGRILKNIYEKCCLK